MDALNFGQTDVFSLQMMRVRCLRTLFVLSAITLTLFGTNDASAQSSRGFLYHSVEAEGEKHLYAVYVPAGLSLQQKVPVVMYLHGAGERGDDPRLPLSIGIGPFLDAATPFITVFPQCEDVSGQALKGWAADGFDGKRAMAILKDLRGRYSTDEDRTILTGWSMGGYGVWELAAAYPDQWSAIVPIAGGGDPAMATKVKDIPIWAFHGENDGLIPVKRGREMVEAVREAGGTPLYTEVSGGNHDIWLDVYGSRQVLDWMLNPKSEDDGAELAANVKFNGKRPKYGRYGLQPFKPAVDLSQAAYVRINNELLKSLSAAVTEKVNPGMLRGGIRNISMGQTVQGRRFTVTFARNSYSADLERASIQASGNGRLSVRMALRNINIRIGGTSISGQRHYAATGPINIRIGYRGSVTLALELEPYVSNRQIKFRQRGTQFNIPANNYSVSRPAVTRTQGIGMTAERVSSGIVNGLYGSRARIESEIQTAVPSVIAELERQINFDDYGDFVSTFWPLPAYAPRVKLWPDDFKVDANGVSLVLGMTAASQDPFGPAPQLRSVNLGGPTASQIVSRGDLQIGVSPRFLEPLTNLLVSANRARVNILDIPEPTFHRLVEPEFLKTILTAGKLQKDMTVRAELILTAPIRTAESKSGPVSSLHGVSTSVATKRVSSTVLAQAVIGKIDAPTSGNAQTGDQVTSKALVRLLANGIRIEYSAFEANSKSWKPLGHFDLKMQQNVELSTHQPSFTKRSIQTEWIGEPALQVTSTFGEEASVTDEFRKLFLAGWSEWTEQQSSAFPVPDLDFGSMKYRIDTMNVSENAISATFQRPGIKITNSSEVALTYQIKSPNSPFGGPYMLEPGKTHRFNVSTSLKYRSQSEGETVQFTLPIGSHSEYRKSKNSETVQLFLAE